jgi:putative transposase
MQAIDRIHLEYPFYGFRRIRVALRDEGFRVGKKRVISLMKIMCIETIYPKPNTSLASPENRIYPYLLRHLPIDHSNQVWEMDITYIAMSKGFMYLTAIIDVYSRYVVGWGLSNTMEARYCVYFQIFFQLFLFFSIIFSVTIIYITFASAKGRLSAKLCTDVYLV